MTPEPVRDGTAGVPAPSLAVLTGVRSGKHGYYLEYRRTAERLATAVASMDDISRALVQTVAGPRTVLEAVLRAAVQHVPAQAVVLAFGRRELPAASPRYLVVRPDGSLADVVDPRLPTWVAAEVERLREGRWAEDRRPSDAAAATPAGPWHRVRATLDGRSVGALSLAPQPGMAVQPADLPVLRTLANQAAVAVHNAALYQESVRLRTRSERLYEEASRQAADLAQRNRELEDVNARLVAATQRELLDVERHRIARELHDSVTQQVLSAGMLVDICATDAAALGETGQQVAARLDHARSLTAEAVEQLRHAIWALSHEHGDGAAGHDLPGLLQRVTDQHRMHLDTALRIEGSPHDLTPDTCHALARIAGEALFNVAAHAGARRAVVRLVHGRDGGLRLSIADDGQGDPAALRRLLRLEQVGDGDGRHRGLVNMAERAREVGGRFAVHRSRMGGVRIDVDLPVEAVREQTGPARPSP
ncbi:histidine kinase [Aquipuribacter sp. MA13-6]|uniref:histidine kinase n=1 Tax=unclassified Aquipuribacter TaxID=2635084 RepID=UPI003EF0184C